MTITPALLDEIDAAMVQAMTAIDDWLSIYASDMCDDARVEEARKRVNEHGTLWYIACVQKVNSDALAKLRSARSSDPTPAMSAETMREAAANVADKCAEQNKAAAIKLRKRQHSETDTWNSNELDDTAAEAEAIAITIRALPLTAPKEG